MNIFFYGTQDDCVCVRVCVCVCACVCVQADLVVNLGADKVTKEMRKVD